MPGRHACLSLAEALVACCILAAASSAREAVQVQSDADKQIIEGFLKRAAADAAGVTPDAVKKIEQTEDITWTWSHYVQMPLVAYKLTGDAKHLDCFVAAMDAMLTRLRKGPDGYIGFRGQPISTFRDKNNPAAECDVNITEFTIAHIICDFIELVNAEDALKQKYAEKTAKYLDLAEGQLAGKKWEARKEFRDIGKDGAVFVMATECGDQRRNLTDPHNKQSKMCRALLALYRVTGKDEYFRTAVKLGVRYKHTLKLDGDRYLWNYWDPAGEWDRKPGSTTEWRHWIGPEHKGGYHGLTVQMAAELYDHGIVFDKTDMQRFVNTQMKVCWNGAMDSPVFKNTGGKPLKDQVMVASSLARFEPKIWDFCYGERATKERLAKREHSWQGGVVALGYLYGKYLSHRSPDPTRAKYREQFCQKPENAAFLKEMEFQVAPGKEANR